MCRYGKFFIHAIFVSSTFPTQPLMTMTLATRKLFTTFFFVAALSVFLSTALGEKLSRQTISLDGTWQIAEGKLDVVPDTFSRTIPVPGLVDMATPAFDGIPTGVQAFKDPKRDAFWYRREFDLDSVAPHVRLKVHKAMFGTKVFLNGKEIGEYLPSFTPAYYDVTDALKKGKNEILIRIGADFQSVLYKATIPYDKEKLYYIPGIFDSVELIGTGKVFVENIQTVPDIEHGKVRAQIRLVNKGNAKVSTSVDLRVAEYKSGKAAGNASIASVEVPADSDVVVDAVVDIADCQLWSPESPFLYVFEAATNSDRFTTRFGMRSFRFNQETRFAELNGKPYFMRGSNFTLYRFFEDQPPREYLPWNRDWVQLLHERVKEMHWNSIRYCIGFPPEFWYDIADEVGILIQDEFPIWMMNVKEANQWLDTDQLVAEYTDWMRERWNHPCVVIWDACNETACPKTVEATNRVRGLDLSNRPWDNAWSPPAAPGDSRELHPYHFMNRSFRLNQMPNVRKELQGPRDPYGVIVNEYGWLWLNRDGSPTAMTTTLYPNFPGKNETPEQRFYTYATYTAAETEWFRAHRQCAGVLHFAMLAYSRPGGDTSDHWMNVETLEWEPSFFQYVRDAFHPVGLMLDYWNDYITQGKDTTASVPVMLINDLETPWKGQVKCRIVKDGKIVWEKETAGSIEPYGTSTVTFDVTWPQETGAYRLEASISGSDQKPVVSVRDFSVLHPTMIRVPIDDAFASSTYDRGQYPSKMTLTADKKGYWSSAFRDDEWIMFSFGEKRQVGRIIIYWQAPAAKFDIKVSNDAETWTEVFKQDAGMGGDESVKFTPVECRFLRINCRERAMKPYGNAIWFVEVFQE